MGSSHSYFWYGWLPFKQNIELVPTDAATYIHSPESGYSTAFGPTIDPRLYFLIDPRCPFGYLIFKSVTSPADLKWTCRSVIDVLALYLNVLGLFVPFVLTAYVLFQKRIRTVRSWCWFGCLSFELAVYLCLTYLVHQTRPFGSCVRIPGMPSGHSAKAYLLLTWYLDLRFGLGVWKRRGGGDRGRPSLEDESLLPQEEEEDWHQQGPLEAKRRASVLWRFEEFLMYDWRGAFVVVAQLGLIPWSRYHARDHAPIQILYGAIIGVICALIALRVCRASLQKNACGGTSEDLEDDELPSESEEASNADHHHGDDQH